MNDDLFANLPPVKSPRLIWMEEHGITVERKASSTGLTWTAKAMHQTGLVTAKSDDSENDALIALAVKLGIKLWNQ